VPTVDLTSFYQPQGSTSDGTKFDNMLANLQSVINGLDASNFAAGKIFDPAKLLQNAAADGDGLVWDNGAGIWRRTSDKPMRVAALAPGTNGQILTTSGGAAVWANPSGVTSYRKTTAKAVTNTVTETDLLNGEIQVAGNVLGTTGVMRLTASGDWVNNSGGAADVPRFKLKLGAGPPTVILDSSVMGATIAAASASRFGWKIVAETANLGATNSQWTDVRIDLSFSASSTAASVAAFATGEGNYQAVYTGSQKGYAIGVAGNTSAIDTTAAMNVILSVINPTASATCETKLYRALVEII
jgi:hypothetical protein